MLDWGGEVREALSMAIDHLSLYQLTIEQGTAFYNAHQRGTLVIPDEDLAADMYDLTQELCNDAGLAAYEISNHAREGEEADEVTLVFRNVHSLGDDLL